MPAISIKGLSKVYRRYRTKWARLADWLDPLGKTRYESQCVLDSISLDVNKGEALGIVGFNGAGKSTLLKLISGTSAPTSGSIQINGRVSALLELGLGFHPDFTGRENAYMAAQLLGYQSNEIHDLMPHIERFAEIGHHIDEPVRTYSSGMQMRLAFSVATAKRPDILIVDEALSVGDAYFQHKSFERIRQFRRDGTTLLLVSHDKQAILSICDRCILLDKGRILRSGPPDLIMDYYNAMLASGQEQTIAVVKLPDHSYRVVSGTGEATTLTLELLDHQNSPVEVVRVGQTITLRVKVRVHADIPRLIVGYGIKDRLGQVMYGTNTHIKGIPVLKTKSGDELAVEFRFDMTLGPGEYSIQTSLSSSETHLLNNYEWRERALLFKVINTTGEEFSGCNWMNPSVKIDKHHDSY
ncbi:ABC transporter ATP-binding protein [Orrella marina]|uniref:Sugar ABC transporter ATP-binding protein n=1 Tax=Orrella marina TaxID=2163011 RepID=A0A2R4XMM1_9BURK|nr:ABC transporter ATP-binding protein [Orrella marina]AWB35014.1 sugar ABC transporter ATP-binding protein [Orrella marina]